VLFKQLRELQSSFLSKPSQTQSLTDFLQDADDLLLRQDRGRHVVLNKTATNPSPPHKLSSITQTKNGFKIYEQRREIQIYVNDIPLRRSRVSSGSIVSDYGLDDRTIGVRSPAGAKDFSSSLCVQTGSGAHPHSCTVGTGGPFPGGKSAAGA
jgi:hypothetical protein